MEFFDTTEEHLDEIKAIADVQFGPDYIDLDDTLNSLVSIHVKQDGQIACYGTATIGYPQHDLGCGGRMAEDAYEECGLVCNVATKPEYQGKGLATAVTKELLRRLKEHGCDLVVASAWRSKKGVNIGVVFDRCGFKSVNEIPMFWSECEGICADCGENCICSAVIYEIRLS